MLYHSPTITGSLTVQGTVSVTEGVTGTATTASYVQFSGVEGLTSFSSSVESRVATNEADISSLTSQTSSYLLNSTDTLDGDLTVTGKITAQEFHTEFVSASIVYQSGSTKFGDTADDRMSITGSVHQSGSDSYFLGNVGIGTTSPSTKFYLSGAGSVFTLNRPTIGTILLSLDSTKNEIFSRDGGTGNFPLAFIIGSTERMRIDSSGNVGIGTTAKKNGYPSGFSTLSVSGNGTDKAGIIELQGNRDANGNQVGMIQFWNTNTSDYETSRISGLNSTTSVYDGQLQFLTRTSGSALTTSMIITEDGNVGIGTVSPTYLLDVIESGATSVASTFAITRITGADPVANDLQLVGPNTSQVRINFGDTDDSDVGQISYVHSTNTFNFITNTQNRLSINGSGDIVFNENGNDSDFRVESDTQTHALFVEGSSGYVGIGTASPNDKLHVYGASANIVANLESGDPNVYLSFKDSATSDYTSVFLGATGNDMVFFSGGGTERMRITSGGVVAIGTSTPNGAVGKLEMGIDGAGNGIGFYNGTGTSFRIWRDSNIANIGRGSSPAISIDTSLNVGIGTTSPTANLQVNGAATSSPQVNLNDAYYVFAANTTKSQSNTHTITIPFTSQAAQYCGFVVEIVFTATWASGDTPIRGGRATYAFNTLNAIVDLTEIEDTGIDVTFAGSSSGMNFIVTATTTSTGGQEPDRIGAVARIVRNNPSQNVYPLSMTIA